VLDVLMTDADSVTISVISGVEVVRCTFDTNQGRERYCVLNIGPKRTCYNGARAVLYNITS
jgi:hypothetical protein